jgi:heptaprenyl diphosphate synthase
MNKTFHTVFLGLLIAQSLALFVIEGMLPVPFIAPGAKLGLANLITVIALYTMPHWRDALLVLLVRIMLATMFGGGPTIFIYSLAGGLLSFTAMLIIRKLGKSKLSIIGVSAVGAFFHNVGQLAVAVTVIQSTLLWLYLPVLALVGIVTGIAIGFVANLTVPHIKKLPGFANWTTNTI